jgi:hypothetical protein
MTTYLLSSGRLHINFHRVVQYNVHVLVETLQ